MNDFIQNRINQNRDAFDNDRPDEKVWNAIHRELHPEEKKKEFPWLKLVAVFVVGFLAYRIFFVTYPQQKTETSMVETYVDTFWKDENNSDSLKLRDGSLKNAQNKPTFEWDFRPFRGNQFKTKEYSDNNLSHVGFRGVTIREKTSDVSHFYVDQTEINPYNYNISAATHQLEVSSNIVFNATGTYTVTVTDLNACNFSTADSDNMYDFSHDLNPKFEYKNGNAYLANGSNAAVLNEEQLDPGYYYEQYDEFEENKFIHTSEESVTTFGIDVDGAGYSNMRRYISSGYLPPKNAVKLEEMINYFDYNLPEPKSGKPFAVFTESGKCPWNEKNELFQICLRGKTIPQEDFPSSNLVFLIDVSGSMSDANKLPLLLQGFKMLVKQMREEDKISIVVYAGAAGVVLHPSSGANKDKILESLMSLEAGGSTAGGEGIELAYSLASKHFIKGGNNRIILATDGDFNVGVTDDDALVRLIEEKRKSGIFLSVLGFGEGNLQASKMEKIADNGNGNFYYIDNILEAKKVLMTEMGGTLHTIAKDVKLQLEFNPQQVKSYRLLGYENRVLANEDFDNDLKDAGDMGSGHTVVAFYEIVPADGKTAKSEKRKYTKTVFNSDEKLKDELATIKIRYKEPTSEKSKKRTYVIEKDLKKNNSSHFMFASAVAEFGLLIRDSEFKSKANFDSLIERAVKYKGKDEKGYRAEFIRLAEQGQLLYEEYLRTKKEKAE